MADQRRELGQRKAVFVFGRWELSNEKRKALIVMKMEGLRTRRRKEGRVEREREREMGLDSGRVDLSLH